MLLLVVAGLLAMHGIAGHGTHKMAMPPHTGRTHASHAPAATQPVSRHHGVAAPAAGSPLVAAAAIVSPTPLNGTGKGVAGACVAVLLGMTLLWWARAGSRLVRGLRPWRHSAPAFRRGRDPDPPSLVRLSIHRC